ncbi:MAG: NAD(P)-dependent oxidoreductase [Gammaproteobacteria bacterium]|nr:NAD(P)-dependent oxidoreductase [Gammaproteobacteria bacterium]
MTSIGLIGLGAMGAGMARNLAKAGFLAGVYNRTASKAQALSDELGVVAFDTPPELAAACELILICISRDEDVLEMVTAVAQTVKPGAVVVDMSTVNSATAQQAAEILAEKQAQFLDAPVSGGVEGAKKGTLAMMVGGSNEALDKIRPILASIAARILHMGPVGSGQATKAVNQIMAAGINQAVTEALAFGEAQGLPMDKVIEVVSGGAAGNWFLEHRGPTMMQGTFAPGFKLALHHKDLEICRAMTENAETPIPLAEMTLLNYKQLMDQGFGDEDISALYRLKKPRKFS